MERTNLKGRFHIAVLGEDGEERSHQVVPNTIMNAGIKVITGLMLKDVGEDAFDYLAIGTDNTAPNATDTSMGAEKYRVEGTGSQETDSVTDDTARLTGSIAITSSISVQEAGVFNSDSAGDMLARTTFSSVSVNDGDTVNIGYDVVVS